MSDRERTGFARFLRDRRAVQFALLACAVLPAGRAFAHPIAVESDLPSLAQYLGLGFTHILSGFDHLLFLLGLILLRGRLRELLWAVTAFTLAHSVTLGLTVLDVLRPQPQAVEALIALSIAYVGLENLLGRRGRRAEGSRFGRRWRVAFAFGLVHGCGFAAALREIGLPAGRTALALALFNFGVELGQLLVLAMILLAGARLTRLLSAVRLELGARSLSAALVAVGVIWAGERALAPAPANARETASEKARSSSSIPPGAGDRPRSVYPSVAHGDDAAVRALCVELNQRPRERRAECNGERPGVTLAGECERMLGAAVVSGAVAFQRDRVSACVSAVERRYADCSFMRSVSLPALAECSALIQGKLAAGAECRSSLECAPGLHCRGVGPLDTGRCAAAEPAGTKCNLAVDPLASYVSSDETLHPECAGSCERGRCVERLR